MANSYTQIKRVQLIREGSMRGRHKLDSSGASRDFFKLFWTDYGRDDDQEHFVIAALNTKLYVDGVITITTGTLDASLVHPREVFKPAIAAGASAIVCSHNHPSGDPAPSPEDKRVDEKLQEVGKLIGIQVLDHIIFGSGTGDTVSLREW